MSCQKWITWIAVQFTYSYIFNYCSHHPVITSSPSEDHTYSAGNENADGTTTTTTTAAATGDKVNGNGVGSSNGVKNGAFAFGGAADERT